MHKAKDLRNQSLDELELLYHNLQKGLYEIVNQWKISKKLNSSHLIREHKKDIAKVLTVLQEKKAGAN